MDSLRKINWLIMLGAAVIVLSSVNLWAGYLAHAPSPFDIADAETEASDFIPIVVPVLARDYAAPTLRAYNNGQAAASGPGISGLRPERLVIPSIYLFTPIIPVDYKDIETGGQVYHQWKVPAEFAAGWQDTSALLGVPGNMVLNGHHNAYGMVFKDLVRLSEGDVIEIYSGDWKFTYEVAAKLLLPERGQTLETRLENSLWIQPSDDERLTLVTCWPGDSNTHRVIVVALPVGAPQRVQTGRGAGQ